MSQKKEKVDIQDVFTKGGNVCLGGLCVRFIKNDRLKTRFSFVCGKKNVPLAVLRNTIKRQMREGIVQISKEVVSGTDIVFVFRGKEKISFSQMNKEMRAVLEKSNLLKKSNG